MCVHGATCVHESKDEAAGTGRRPQLRLVHKSKGKWARCSAPGSASFWDKVRAAPAWDSQDTDRTSPAAEAGSRALHLQTPVGLVTAANTKADLTLTPDASA